MRKTTDTRRSQTFRQSEYARLLNTFISVTREKDFLHKCLLDLLPDRKGRYLDVGAGDGTLTRRLAPLFTHVAAIECNDAFRESLESICDELVIDRIENVELSDRFDFVLVSHVLGYLDQSGRKSIVRKLHDVLRPEGILVFVYNSSASEAHHILEMLSPFSGRCWANQTPLSEPLNLVPDGGAHAAIARAVMPVQLDTASLAGEVIEFLAFGDRPLRKEGRTALEAMVAKYKNANDSWLIPLEHEFFCISRSAQVLRSRKFLCEDTV